MVSRWLVLFILSFSVADAYAQGKRFTDTVSVYFAELKAATERNKSLWGIDLYGPVLLVIPATREIYANSPDTAGWLKKEGDLFVGKLPQAVNISNTSLHWAGQHWAMIMLPLSSGKQNRINLLSHELFHRAQPKLGFKAFNPDNNHLDKREGRIYLRLELEALKNAMVTTSRRRIKKHIADALSFRARRHSLFAGADSTENLLELNEGICEYTGMIMSERTVQEQKEQFLKRVDYFTTTNSYVRSFAYETIPLYGYLLSARNKNWHRTIDTSTNLTAYFTRAFRIKKSSGPSAELDSLSKKYKGSQIEAEEWAREEKMKQQMAAYRNRFFDNPHVRIPLQNMNMSFDYTRMLPLDDKGTVYPLIRITDNWGVLDVTDGALINAGWNQVHLSFPTAINDNKITGDGWTLELNPAYVLEKDSDGKNYVVRKKK